MFKLKGIPNCFALSALLGVCLAGCPDESTPAPVRENQPVESSSPAIDQPVEESPVASALRVGACCLPDASCEIATEADCELAGGAYRGDGASCDPYPCAAGNPVGGGPGGFPPATNFAGYRGVIRLSSITDIDGNFLSYVAEGTVEFGDPYDLGRIYSDAAPGIVYRPIRANSSVVISQSKIPNCTQVGTATGTLTYGNLMIRTDANEVGFEIDAQVVDELITWRCEVNGIVVIQQGGGGPGFGLGGGDVCPPVFVPLGPSLQTLQGRAEWACDKGRVLQAAVLEWNLTGY